MILSFIKFARSPQEVLKTSGFALGFQHLLRGFANVSEWKIMFDPYISRTFIIMKVIFFKHCIINNQRNAAFSLNRSVYTYTSYHIQICNKIRKSDVWQHTPVYYRKDQNITVHKYTHTAFLKDVNMKLWHPFSTVLLIFRENLIF